MKIKINTKHIPIKDAEIGMFVKTFDIQKNENTFIEIDEVFEVKVPKEERRIIKYADGTSMLTSTTHRMLYLINSKLEYVQTENVTPGMLQKKDGTFTEVVSISPVYEDGKPLYDLHIPHTNNYYADGKVSHNSATVFVPAWHYEIENILVLKNNKGTDDNRVRKLDYCIQWPDLFMERIKKNEDVTLFCPHECRELYDNFGKGKEWEELYLKYEKKRGLKFKKVVSARNLVAIWGKERIETGRIYAQFIDTESVWKEPVKQSNLCVAPETKVLTNKGYIQVKDLQDKEVTIWNGFEWSDVIFRKTGENRKLVRVVFSNGSEVECTPDHEWSIMKSYKHQQKRLQTKVATKDIKIGTKLFKCSLPSAAIEESDKTIKYAYTQGFFAGDGCCYEGKNILYLYGEKKKLVPYIDYRTGTLEEDSSGRLNFSLHHDMMPKFFVPTGYSTKTKLEWLSGYLDADGCISKNNIQVTSVNRELLLHVKDMLDTLGISSNVTPRQKEGYRVMPDGKGGKKEYFCKQSFILMINAIESRKLVDLGLSTKRLQFDFPEVEHNRACYVKVTDIIDEGRYDNTYCCTEPKNHTMFVNGVLSGQCVEILHPTKPIYSLDDEEGEIGVCILGAINILVAKLEEYPQLCKLLVRLLDSVISHQDYPIKACERFATRKRSIAVGLTNVAAFLAKNKTLYTDENAVQLLETVAEHLQYYLIFSSVELAKELGPCQDFEECRYSAGWLPVDKHTEKNYKLDWEHLRNLIAEHGMRNCTLTAQMPVENASLSTNSTNGMDPVRSILSYKKSRIRPLKQLVPNPQNKNHFQLAFNIKDNRAINSIYAAVQKYFDMSMSLNHYYDYNDFENGVIPLSIIIKDMIDAWEKGLRTMYYAVSNDGSDDVTKDNGCESGACAI